jgi:hypothetical protein
MSNDLEITQPAAGVAAGQPAELVSALSLPTGFKVAEVPAISGKTPTPPPSLGPLAAFSGTFTGSGFNTIFRPDSKFTPTVLPTPVSSDNILELNLTSETLSFSASLGSVPNRGEVQGDVFLNGVPYLQTISDVTNPGQPTGIHLEPGLWVIVPATTDPPEGVTLVRMASIPHGTTIQAQGTSATAAGAPTIPAVDITPFSTAQPDEKIPFPSQTATTQGTPRIPQDLTSFIAAGTITQAILTDPNTVLRKHLTGLKITSTTTIFVSTTPASPLFGGGTDNIAFLLGSAGATAPNAQALRMQAVFWIETVEYTLTVPPYKPGQAPLALKPQVTGGGPVPTFTVEPPIEITTPRTITVTATQIQYSQQVFLNFNTLTWPHVSVATLVPAAPIPVPRTAFV